MLSRHSKCSLFIISITANDSTILKWSQSHFPAKLVQEKLLEFVPNLPLCLLHRLLNRHGPGTHSLSSSVSQKSFLCSNFNPFYTLKCVQGARGNELAALPMLCLAFLSLAITVDPQKRGEKLKQALWSDYWLSCVRLLFPSLIFFIIAFPYSVYISLLSSSFYLLSWFLPSIFIRASPLLSCFYFASLDELL